MWFAQAWFAWSAASATPQPCLDSPRPGDERPSRIAPTHQVLLDVAESLHYLHSLKLLHCDVKIENILLKTDPTRGLGFVPKVGAPVIGADRGMATGRILPFANRGADW